MKMAKEEQRIPLSTTNPPPIPLTTFPIPRACPHSNPSKSPDSPPTHTSPPPAVL